MSYFNKNYDVTSLTTTTAAITAQNKRFNE